jgi:hypothetical protein
MHQFLVVGRGRRMYDVDGWEDHQSSIRNNASGGHMLDEQMIAKLEAWVQTHPDSADTPFMNVSTGENYTVRDLLKQVQASLAGTAVLTETVQAELNQLESWVGGL